MGGKLRRLTLQFTGKKKLSIVESQVPVPGSGEVLVRSLLSAISPGTEMLVYRGQLPDDLVQDETITALQGTFAYPFTYGYSMVGQVLDLGPDVPLSWQDQLVFAFWPHESCFTAPLQDLILLPPGLAPEDAVFLPNMETAVNLVLDSRPLLGERVGVFGQGVVGLLTTALLARFPLGPLVTLDAYPLRRAASRALGVTASLDPAGTAVTGQVLESLGGEADLSLELSGSPAALDQAIAVTGFSGRIVIGSWYGNKRAPIDLGGKFHRARLHLISSQVSSVAPNLTGRWDKARRLDKAWEMLLESPPQEYITHRFPLADAARAYALIDQSPEETIQVVLDYPD